MNTKAWIWFFYKKIKLTKSTKNQRDNSRKIQLNVPYNYDFAKLCLIIKLYFPKYFPKVFKIYIQSQCISLIPSCERHRWRWFLPEWLAFFVFLRPAKAKGARKVTITSRGEEVAYEFLSALAPGYGRLKRTNRDVPPYQEKNHLPWRARLTIKIIGVVT